MPMTRRSPLTDPERILAFGNYGTGKSDAYMRIARMCPDATFYAIDTDYSASYSRALETDYSDLTNFAPPIRVAPDDWPGQLAAIQSVKAVMKPNDWLSFDSMTPTWDAVQGWFTEQVFGMEVDSYFLGVRQKMESDKAKGGDDKKALGAFDGWKDYVVINKTYFKIYSMLSFLPGHVWLTAEQDSISKDEKDRDTLKTYGPYGVKPKGQKKLGFTTSTVLLFTKSRSGEYKLTTVKDRNRRELEDELIVPDFGQFYLKGVAGWKLTPYQAEG